MGLVLIDACPPFLQWQGIDEGAMAQNQGSVVAGFLLQLEVELDVDSLGALPGLT
ncbi:hypothetical protein D3C76_1795200 [compost metagenome]